ncbi:hypothetical protein EUX98_g7750 [Antrodiella citrinella]|uniref:Cupin type-1 domain-containing protein n=1 Tax=Antrodiella citrinella TaxID=2447956 RepID=A0A4S4MML7_9APHY|nr:hypothetical protein EUX98_g7750 [Antrodiella citrinella]
MRPFQFLSAKSTGLVALAFAAAASISGVHANDSLQVTALVGRDMKSTIECWTLSQKYGNIRGMKIQQLGDLERTSYAEMPDDKDFEQGLYTAPNVQFFIILEGNATITFPTSDEILHVQPSRLYIATDNAATSELGHITVVHKGSRLIQFPFKDGVIPEHTATPGECASTAARTRDEFFARIIVQFDEIVQGPRLPTPTYGLDIRELPISKMLALNLLTLLAVAVAPAYAHFVWPKSTDTGAMQVNAIVGINGSSTVECWTLNTTITSAADVQSFGSIDGASYSYYTGTAPIDAGTHTAPNLQYFAILKGGATITFPSYPDNTLTVESGQFYIAADGPATSTVGHHTELVGGSLVLQLPFAGGVLPAYTASSGLCPRGNFDT